MRTSGPVIFPNLQVNESRRALGRRCIHLNAPGRLIGAKVLPGESIVSAATRRRGFAQRRATREATVDGAWQHGILSREQRRNSNFPLLNFLFLISMHPAGSLVFSDVPKRIPVSLQPAVTWFFWAKF
ncbi:hypothetical protein Q8A73_002667 [Channa argus]|nr:hypothetical protein Q8A73_002667 [Channa argus]